MSHLTEQEIIACLTENLRLGAENGDKLAAGERGPIYLTFRENLRLVEGCCRQMASWRGDTRWLPFGMKVAEAQKRCGDWLRAKEPAWRFSGLAEILRFALGEAKKLETMKTGTIGPILPEMMVAPTRTQGRPIAVPAAYKKIKPHKATLIDVHGKPLGTVH